MCSQTPEIASDENSLSKSKRRTLAQLSCEYSTAIAQLSCDYSTQLNSYLWRLNKKHQKQLPKL